MKILCLIPAKKNSLRLPNKNFLKLHKKPLVEWTIILSSKIKFFNKIVVSSDDNRILKLKKKYPKIFFLKRPKKISNSYTKMENVIKHTLNEYKKNDENFDAIVILQPTSPLRKIKTIINAIKKFKKYKPNYLVSISKMNHNQNPKMLFKINKKDILKRLSIPIIKDNKNYPYYCLDGGVVFIFRVPNKRYTLNGTASFIKVKFPENIDIDNKHDFLLAKKFFY
ncbi:acylneuraminate cytidylyltransferase family protein [Candidatus Pelagibacter sp.]|nr:acylneuraminate cytidylyltransferase family protein [Candidatus Pelagibacter sp.]